MNAFVTGFRQAPWKSQSPLSPVKWLCLRSCLVQLGVLGLLEIYQSSSDILVSDQLSYDCQWRSLPFTCSNGFLFS